MTRQARPNIIVVLCDDLGFGDLGVLFQNRQRRLHPDLPTLRTPHLDTMAAQGLILEGMYCSAPLCAPSRASLLTGRTQGHADVRDSAFDRALEDADNLATVLHAQGYATAAFGKWGLQGDPEPGVAFPDAWPAYPTRRGFDDFFGYVRHADGHEHYPKEGLYRGPKQVWDNEHEVSAGLDGCYTTDLFTAKAKDWIAERCTSGDGRPFFVYLAYDTPHAVTELPACAYPEGGGLHGGVRWLGEPGRMINTASGEPDTYVHPHYRDATSIVDGQTRPWPDVYRRYATAVRRIDDCVGDLLALLSDLDIDEDTLVLFTSDNGPSIESYLDEPLRADFFASYGPFDGIKRDCWEGGLRVGALVRAPSRIAAGRTSTDPVQFHDLLPTFAELAGAVPPARTDGVSLVPLLTGHGEQRPSTVYVEFAAQGRTPDYASFGARHRNRLRGQMQVLRVGRHVGIRYDIHCVDDPFEIYDVIADPQQEHDLAADLPALQQEFLARVPRTRMPHPEVPRPYDAVPAPSVPDPGGRPDRAWRRTFTGDFAWVPLLDDVQPATQADVAWPDDIEPAPAGTSAMLYTGHLRVATDGWCRFELETARGSLLRIHDALVVERSADDRGDSSSGVMCLARGAHPFRLYVQGHEPPRIRWRRLAGSQRP